MRRATQSAGLGRRIRFSGWLPEHRPCAQAAAPHFLQAPPIVEDMLYTCAPSASSRGGLERRGGSSRCGSDGEILRALAAAGLLAVVAGGSDLAANKADCSVAISEEAPEGKFDAARWASTLSKIKTGIVSLSVTSVRAFDTHTFGTGSATGFVVDAEKGLILTNRHVTSQGPVVATALFDNHEEVDLKAVYRDPVHDFGLFRYDPAQLKHMGGVAELKLRPDKAKQGLDVKVIGNNAGEKLTVLGAMLARLDREAPFYGRFTYNDFNTFYFQAGSNTSGGSSGSPVVDADGDVIALNAAGKAGTAASFYLPLERVSRAVELLRQGKEVPRGTLQATFVFKPFFELARFGLAPEQIQAARAAGEDVGMLVVQSIVPKGPASGVLEPGDVLLSVQGTRISRFAPLEAILDDGVGETITLEVERGGKTLSVTAVVGDLHAITPHEFLECGDAVFNNFSYQLARCHNVPVDGLGVFVASQGYMLRLAGIPSSALITQVGEHRTRNVQELEAALTAHPDGTRVPVYCMDLGNPTQQQVGMMRIDRTWFPMQLTTRDDPEVGIWTSRPSPPPPEKVLNPSPNGRSTSARFAPGTNAVEKALTRSLVKVTISVPLAVDGMRSLEFIGTGMVVDEKRGLVVCDRNTAPGALCDCLVTFGSSCTIPAHVAYIHPLHNLAVLSYDPALVQGAGVEAVKLKPCSAHELHGQKLWHISSVGSMRSGCSLVSDKGQAIVSQPLMGPASTPPRWQETNIDLVTMKGGASWSSSQDGVLANDEGEVVAYWASFLTQTGRDGRAQDSNYFAGITADTISDMLGPLQGGEPPPVLHTLGVEMEKLGLAAVRDTLMDPETVDEVEARCKHWPPQVMSVRRRCAGTNAQEKLRDSDIILEINGQPIETFRQVEVALRESEADPSSSNTDASPRTAKILLARAGKKLQVDVATSPVVDLVTNRIVCWCGAVLQTPPAAIAAQRGQAMRGVYVASRFHGSPAASHGLSPMSRIVEVDGKPTPDLDALLRIVVSKKDGESVRVKRLDLRDAQLMTSMRVDGKYWPLTEIRRVPGSRTPGGCEPYHWQRSDVTVDPDTGELVFADANRSPLTPAN